MLEIRKTRIYTSPRNSDLPLSAPQRPQDGQTLPCKGSLKTEAAGRPLAAMVADTSIYAQLSDWLLPDMTRRCESEAARMEGDGTGLRGCSSVPSPVYPHSRRSSGPLQRSGFHRGNSAGYQAPGFRPATMRTLAEIAAQAAGPRPRLPVSEHFPSDRTVQGPLTDQATSFSPRA